MTSSAVSRSIVSGTAYLGSNSLQLTRATAGTAAGVYSASFSAAAGETYTFSAYVKTDSASAYLALNDGSKTVTSEVLAANSGWTRLEVSYTASTAKTLTARLLTTGAGTIYMDCVQVEKAPTASRYNLIQNGDFRTSTFWSSSSGRTTSTAAAPELSTNVYRMTGSPTATNRIYQTVAVSGSAGDTFVLAGWAKGDSASLDNGDTNPREFGIIATFNNTDGTTTSTTVRFNPYVGSSVNWQYAAAAIVAEKAYSSIKIELAYDYNINTAYFDGIQLYKEQFGNSYTYDSNGNIISVKDVQSQTTTYEYTNNDLTKQVLPSGAALTYTYDNYHNVKTATSDTGVVYSFGYDTYGNNTSVSIVSGSVKLTSSAEYTSDGNRLASTTDAAGKVTTYSYHENTNVLQWVQYPEDTTATRTEYTYDNMYRLAKAEADVSTGSTLKAEYGYTNDLLTSIKTGSTNYSFTYGAFALRSNIKIGSRTLASYSYTSRNNFLDTLAYGNGDSVKYTYDKQGRVTKQTYEDGDTVSYAYDNNGALASVTDSATGITTKYYYDFTNRLMKYKETGSGYSHSVGYEYDEINNLTALVETINGVQHETAYTYDDDNRITEVSNGSVEKQYVYDAYGRLVTQITTQDGATVQTETFTYTNPSASTTSAQIKTHTIQSAGTTITYTYTYDNNGNILSVCDGSNTTSYVYDSANQLLRENNQAGGFTHVWTYDDAGNILKRQEYGYTTGTLGAVLDTVNYGYGNSAWGDLLTTVDSYIHYDSIGNPLNNKDDSHANTWEHGRELASTAVSSEFAIISQPEDDKCLPTGRAYFYVEAAGTDLTYQWQWFNGSTWIDSKATGAKTNSMSVAAAGENGTTYRCVITDDAGNVLISDSAKVVHVPILITSQPTDWWGTASERAAFTVQVSSTDANLTYQWQWFNGSTWINSKATGAKTNSMSVAAAGENGTTYRCVITDSAGNVAISDSATVHIDPLGFITQPEDCICSPSGRANFSVEVYGTDVSYQWQWHSPGSSTWSNSNAAGAQTNAINLGVSGENGTVYRCVITDAAGNTAISDSATVIPYAVTWDYTYDANGLRTNRSSCAVSYDYIYNGSSLTQLTVTEALDGSKTVMDISYDAAGKPMSLSYNGTRYIYVTNIQGDVTAILNTSGTAVVQYTYDAWGKVLTTTGSMATTLGQYNPLRYRGYVYNTETTFYYLQSRYYDPELDRFINADSYASTGQGILGNNMFAYCRNNSVSRTDASGQADISAVEESFDDDVEVGPNDKELGGGGGSDNGGVGLWCGEP